MIRRRDRCFLAFLITLGFTTSSLCQSLSAKKATFIVKGEVSSPGEFSYEPGMTLRKAIALAKGLTFSARRNQVLILRKNIISGEIEEIRFNVDAKSKNKGKDIAILPDDEIVIPNSRRTPLIVSDSQKKK